MYKWERLAYHLISEHKDCLEGELPLAVVEEVLETGSEEINDQPSRCNRLQLRTNEHLGCRLKQPKLMINKCSINKGQIGFHKSGECPGTPNLPPP